ncbi:hypothetical protein K3495_g3450 [Podosphaera aphanis]|nr:hypothetical protein K3495_g3450 [Podosphaera aphanis]
MEFSRDWQNHISILPGSSGDRFQQYFDMGGDTGFYFNSQNFGTQQQQASPVTVQEKGYHMDIAIENRSEGHVSANQEYQIPDTTREGLREFNRELLPGGQQHSLGESFLGMDTQIQNMSQQRYKQRGERDRREYSRNIFPSTTAIPTPNSAEMHGANSHLFGLSDSQQQTTYDKLHSKTEDHEIAFSPLVSPAVTPHDFRFNSLDYSASGVYFSPLSSPALQAQDGNSPLHDLRNLWLSKSLMDVNYDPLSASMSSKVPTRQNKVQFQPQSSFRMGQSPTLNPKQEEKSLHNSSNCSENGIEPLNSHNLKFETDSIIPQSYGEETKNSPISPESFSNMAPPPLSSPVLASSSPHFNYSTFNNLAKSVSFECPATPASLMKIQPPAVTQDHISNMEDPIIYQYGLSETANTKRSCLARRDNELKLHGTLNSRIIENTQLSEFQQSLPSPSSPHPKPVSSVNQSQSPQSDCLDSISTRSQKSRSALRISRKRANTFAHVSPAILPRISPNLLPSLSNGTTNAQQDSASLFLGSKSNYQNIIEGTNLPGVYYSSELSTNLTSKRTSHKIAEQGRRNRMNSALQELSKLLPRAQDRETGCDKIRNADTEDCEVLAYSKGTPQSANSKASTVEQAIVYINYLKIQLDNANKNANNKSENIEQNLKT